MFAAPARNFGGLGAQSAGEEGGKRRGGRGILIGMVKEPFPLRINEGERDMIDGVGYQRGKGNCRRLGKP
jgi:hypothetical protein